MRKEYRQKTITETVWISDTGEVCSSREAALRLDALSLPPRKIETNGIMMPDNLEGAYLSLYKINNEKDWKYLNYTEWKQNAIGDEYTKPGWYGVIRHSGGDYLDSYEVIYMDKYIRDLKDYLNELTEICEE